MRRFSALLLALTLAACGGGSPELGAYAPLECAPYARQLTGLPFRGDADSWWAQAAGRYPRSQRPAPGRVLVFQPIGRLPSGHVSVVTRVLSSREIDVDHANWVHHRIGRQDPVLDVSPGNDWSQVRVWWAPIRALGTTVYPTYGFISPTGLQAASSGGT